MMSPIQTIATSIAVALFLGVPIGMFKILFLKRKAIKVIGVILSVSVIILSWYMILTVAALLGEQKSNAWALQFSIAYAFD